MMSSMADEHLNAILTLELKITRQQYEELRREMETTDWVEIRGHGVPGGGDTTLWRIFDGFNPVEFRLASDEEERS